MWLGVDVGGPRKRFDVALVDETRLVHLAGRQTVSDVLSILDAWRPLLVAIDSPGSWAPPGATAREGERRLNRAVCGIRWTPDERTGAANPYYRWIVEGLRLYAELESRPAEAIEVFPTASFTRWLGPRTGTRAQWTRRGLARLGLDSLPARTNQDERDAIAAACTARAHELGLTERFGEIVVPRGA